MTYSIMERMKRNYEDRYRIMLTRRMPVIIRIDGRAFHTLTKYLKCKKPFDHDFMNAMDVAALKSAQNMQGFKFAYIQSDEANFLLTDYDKIESEAWFDYNLQKIVSVSASLMSTNFINAMATYKRIMSTNNLFISFDARAFNIPREEISNYFLARAKDWERNSIYMYTNFFFSHKDLLNKSNSEKHEMLHSIGKNWATDLTEREKNGCIILKNNEETYNTEHGFVPTFDNFNIILEQLIYPSDFFT